MDIYRFNNYRDLIKSWGQTELRPGFRSRLAKVTSSSPSWITKVLDGRVHLTPDQAMAIAERFHLEDNEADYFLLLVDLERAGTVALKKRLQKKLETLTKESRNFTTDIKSQADLTEENALQYYSSWRYAAIHVACMIVPSTVEELQAKLRLPHAAVSKALRQLRDMGLVVTHGMQWRALEISVHLPLHHPHVNASHANWRNRTIQFLQEGEKEGLHYSAVHCLSREDAEKIHLQLKEAVLQAREVIRKSPSETLSVFCVDWYGLE